MSRQSPTVGPVPEATARVARAALPRGHLSPRMRDELGPILTESRFAPWVAVRGRPAEAPWRLGLVPLVPYAEGWSGRQAALAGRSRVDWKYALG